MTAAQAEALSIGEATRPYILNTWNEEKNTVF